MPVNFMKLDPITLRGRIAERIKSAILSGVLREGDRLVERRLAEQFTTSLTAVREALIELEAQGFLLRKPNSGTYVTKLSLETFEKLFQLRRVVEGYAVEEAARLITIGQASNLDKCYSELLEVARANEAQAFITKDYALHTALWQCAQNEHLESILPRIVVPIFGYTAIRVASRTSLDLLQDAQAHLPIIAAVKSHDPDGARQALALAMDSWLKRGRAFVFDQSTSE